MKNFYSESGRQQREALAATLKKIREAFPNLSAYEDAELKSLLSDHGVSFCFETVVTGRVFCIAHYPWGGSYTVVGVPHDQAERIVVGQVTIPKLLAEIPVKS